MTPPRVVDRLLSNVTEQDDGCILSRYSIGSHGYSQIGWSENGRTQMRLGHRVAWEAEHGPIPEGLTVDHICRNRRCVNPDHLRLLTNVDNARDKRADQQDPLPSRTPLRRRQHIHRPSRAPTLPSLRQAKADLMSVHTYHPDAHAHGLADGCPRCAEHAEAPENGLDTTMLAALRDRVARRLPARSGAERQAMNNLARDALS